MPIINFVMKSELMSIFVIKKLVYTEPINIDS